MTKCLLLLSGGLDSILAANILISQNIEVVPICFKSYFCGCEKSEKATEQLGKKLRTYDFSEDHLKIVKKPRFGHGKGMNPCIDCHLLMLRKAREIMEKENFDFVATGEVLGERPFSQNINALKLIEKEADLEGLLLRPLSAKVLSETLPEKKGLVKREELLAISGRSRKTQLELVKKYNIEEFPTPAGGCILTDPEYSKKIKELFDKVPGFNGNDAQLLTRGRTTWLNNYLIIIGRNEEENKELSKLKKQGDMVLEPENFPGPTVLVRGFKNEINEEIKGKAREFLLKYSKKIHAKREIREIN